MKSSIPGIIAVQGDSFPTHNYEVIGVYFGWGLGLKSKRVNVFSRTTVPHELNLNAC